VRCEIEDLGRVRLDRHKLVQVLVNVIKNARESVDASGGAGRVTVRALRDGERLRIDVVDDGAGIAAENLARVFNHGFTTKSGGHGFGLHSSANAATEMGGRLGAASAGLGRGATFTLDLPLERAATVEGGSPCNTPTTAAS
jgi:signal transduction histidine kinase